MALTDNLEAFWELEEASGTRVDSAGANDLTDNNTVTQAAGKVGFAAQFTAANSESLTIADNASLSTGDIDFTLAGWIFQDTKTVYHGLAGKWTAAGNQREYLFDYDTASDRFRGVISADGITAVVVSANNLGSVSNATWYFIIFEHNATANTISIAVNNGIADSTAHTGGALNGTSAFRLGARDIAGTFHDGRIDQVGFWKRLLTAEEKIFLFNNGAGQSFAAIEVGLPPRGNNLLLMGVS